MLYHCLVMEKLEGKQQHGRASPPGVNRATLHIAPDQWPVLRPGEYHRVACAVPLRYINTHEPIKQKSGPSSVLRPENHYCGSESRPAVSPFVVRKMDPSPDKAYFSFQAAIMPPCRFSPSRDQANHGRPIFALLVRLSDPQVDFPPIRRIHPGGTGPRHR